MEIAFLACPRVMTCRREGIVCLDLNGSGGGSRRRGVPSHIVLVDELLDKGVRTFLPLRIEDDVSLGV